MVTVTVTGISDQTDREPTKSRRASVSSDQTDQEPTAAPKASASKEKQRKSKPPSRTPQADTAAVWTSLEPKYPGKVTQILPQNRHAAAKAAAELNELGSAHPLFASYNSAKEKCIAIVAKIVEECRRCNLRYRDMHFDIESDLKNKYGADCLYTLSHPNPKDEKQRPRAVKRVHQIFDEPEFYIDGPTPPDIRQGTWNNCWVLAALGCLGGARGLIEKICVARDEKVGVYGFVFYRDGAWDHTIIDDKLYLACADFDESLTEKREWMRSKFRSEPEEEYRKAFQVGSGALYFAGCTLENETWLPLLEKAFAKAHGDYESLDNGFTGEAIEDLTGGVTTELLTSDILDTETFWQELLQVNHKYLFGCSTGRLDTWQGGYKSDRNGIQASHAYSIIDAKEVTNPRDGEREKLLRIRNPWGKTEWTGTWSDGSKEWTDEMKRLLNHESADDGIFWIRYSDWLKKFHFLDRTRLFDDSWYTTQQWTSVQVPWSVADYHATKFTFTIQEESPVVVVLSQLDYRYWRGLEGQYDYSLHFRINKAGEKNDYLVCSHGNYFMRRSVSAELATLPPGTYDVRIKVTAIRYKDQHTIDKVIIKHMEHRQAKLTKTAFSYDMAHAKGPVLENEEDKRYIAGYKDEKARAEALIVAKSLKHREWVVKKKRHDRKKRRAARKKAHHERKALDESLAGGPVLQLPPTSQPNGVNKRRSRRRSKRKSSASESPDTPEFQATPVVQRPGQLSQSRFLSDTSIVQGRTRGLSNEKGKKPDYLSTMSNTSEPSHTPPTPGSTTDTLCSFNSSVDSDLDEAYFPDKYNQNPGILDTDLAELAANPWNAVCVVGLRVFTTTSTTKILVKSEDIGQAEGSITGQQGFEAIGSGFSSYGDRTSVAYWASQQARRPPPLDVEDSMRGLSRHVS